MAPRRTPLSFQAASRALVATLPEDLDVVDGVPALELETPVAEAPRVDRVWLRAGQGRGLRVTLPAITPPGQYAGRITAGKTKRAVLVDVPANPRLRIVPV